MFKPNARSFRYFKARLHPLTKPALWASAGLCGLSLLALVRALSDPHSFWQEGDRRANVNLDGSAALTPEERAQAAELDDLSVLLKDLDQQATLKSLTARPEGRSQANLKQPAAIANPPEVTAPILAQPSSADVSFDSLPLLDLSPRPTAPSAVNGGLPARSTAASGFTGFDPRSSGGVGPANNPDATSTSAPNPLQEALQRQGSITPGVSSSDLGAAANPPVGSRRPGDGSETVLPGVLPYSVPNMSGNPINNPGEQSSSLGSNLGPSLGQGAAGGGTAASNPSGPFAPARTRPIPNSPDNAYTQFLNPDLVVPAAPLPPSSATGFSGNSPGNGLNPSGFNSRSSQFGAIPDSSQSSFQTPAPSNAFPVPEGPVFSNSPGTPVFQPLPTTSPPFSVPSPTPGQSAGNGRIRTFANP